MDIILRLFNFIYLIIYFLDTFLVDFLDTFLVDFLDTFLDTFLVDFSGDFLDDSSVDSLTNFFPIFLILNNSLISIFSLSIKINHLLLSFALNNLLFLLINNAFFLVQ